MILPRLSIAVALCLLLAGCETLNWPSQLKTADHLTLKETTFEQLPGWHLDAQAQGILALQRSCVPIMKKAPEDSFGVGGFAGTAAAWQDVCRDLSSAVPMTDAQARTFLEDHFIPYQMLGNSGSEGLFTGYYEASLRGSYKKHGAYVVPIYGRPDDLVKVNLGDFNPALQGEHIVGRVDEDKDLIPYYNREEIEKGALDKQHKEIVWVDSAVDAFFLHIQGSGRIKMEDGSTLRVGYAVENGQPYVAIGKELVARGALDKDNVSMQTIREWLEQNPQQAAEVMDLNASYIFFNKLAGEDGPLGAEGVALKPRRSLAVDRKIIPYGVPIWLDTEDPDGQEDLQRLMVAQDTGGAIVGAVRGDFFWGDGDEAAHKAGLMKGKGHAWVLLPKTVKPEVSKAPPENDFFAWCKNAVSKLHPHEE